MSTPSARDRYLRDQLEKAKRAWGRELEESKRLRARIAELEATLAERDRELATARYTIKSCMAPSERSKAELEAQLAERDRRIAELEADVDAARQLLADTPAIARAIEAAGVSRLTKLSSRIARLEEALRWYGRRDNYKAQPPGVTPALMDRGERARQALNKENSDV